MLTARGPGLPRSAQDGSTLVVLGGSSPWTVALVDALATSMGDGALPAMDIVLAGRDRGALDAVHAYARHRLDGLPAQVRSTCDLARALAGATVVVHQIRFGGLAGRADDERRAAELGVPADETLGPAALQRVVRSVPGLRRIARLVVRCCPDAVVVNLTNPLGISTSLLHRFGVRHVIGVCELPNLTARRACAVLRVDPRDVAVDYVGLNHRGFIVGLHVDGRNRVGELAREMVGDVGGITGDVVRDLDALPLKYHALVTAPATAGHGRAQRLSTVRAVALEQLVAVPTARPAILDERPSEWYEHAVVPLVVALHRDAPSRHVVDVVGRDGVTSEIVADVSRSAIVPVTPSATPSAAVRAWLAEFEHHERAVLAAALDPSRRAVSEALAADPLVRRAESTASHLAAVSTAIVASSAPGRSA